MNPTPSTTSPLTATLTPAALTLPPGEQTTTQITLLNQSSAVNHFHLNLEGLPADWFTLAPPSAQLMPGDTIPLTLIFHPPRASTTLAGEHPLQLTAYSATDPTPHPIASATLDITPFSEFIAILQPSQVTNKAQPSVTIQNHGNHPTTFTLQPKELDQKLRYHIPEPISIIDPGRTKIIPLTIHPTRRPFIGHPQTKPFQLTVQTANTPLQHPAGQITIQPHLPEWLRPYLRATLALLLILITGYLLLNDLDRDNLPTIVELILGIDSNDPDTDSDGLTDIDELETYQTNPRIADTDHDGLTDWQELQQYHTDPNDFDTDKDNIPDGDEINLYQTNPTQCDTNNNGLSDWVEIYPFADELPCPTP